MLVHCGGVDIPGPLIHLTTVEVLLEWVNPLLVFKQPCTVPAGHAESSRARCFLLTSLWNLILPLLLALSAIITTGNKSLLLCGCTYVKLAQARVTSAEKIPP